MQRTLADLEHQIKQELINITLNKEICEEVNVYTCDNENIEGYVPEHSYVQFNLPLSTLQYKICSIVQDMFELYEQDSV